MVTIIWASFAVENLADAVAKLVVKPKKNLIRPKSYVLLIWFTKKFESVKDFITLKIAQMIDKGRIEKLDKLKDKSMSHEEAIELLVHERR